MTLKIFLIKLTRKIYSYFFLKPYVFAEDYRYVKHFGQEANDLVLSKMKTGAPILVGKFGTIELDALEQYNSYKYQNYDMSTVLDIIKCKYPCYNREEFYMEGLCSNAGFFPNSSDLLKSFYDEYIQSMKQLDVLGSYIYQEKYFFHLFPNADLINIDGYLYPFFYKNPWTKHLKGKRVLVVHPFQREIEAQYKKRKQIWGEIADDILPDFKLITYKSVQSILDSETPYSTWFHALNQMKHDIANIEFDIALVGCGAYGLPLASFCKLLGKQAIHLAGSTQILFGILGKRWLDNPKFLPYFNEHWIHPYEDSKPKRANTIENGCYW